MNTWAAFAMGEANRGKELMVFDWDKAARLIRERKPKCASAGLRSDWEYTGGTIYEDGKPVMDDYTYLASTWAVPELNMDGAIVECYRMKHEVPYWNSDTKWPQSALDILYPQQKIDIVQWADYTAFARENEETALLPVSREQVEKMRGEWIADGEKVPVDENGCPRDWAKCSVCGEYLTASEEYDCTGHFCPACGSPMTDKAVDIVMERLEEICK